MNPSKDLFFALTSEQIMKQYGISVSGNYQVTKMVFHDTALYTSAATNENFYFNQPRAINIARTVTNFNGTGMFPSNEAFLILGIGVGFDHAVTVNTTASTTTGVLRDIELLTWNAAMTLSFAHKEYGIFPLRAIPQGNGPCADIDNRTTVAAPATITNILQFATNGVPSVNNLFRLRYFIEGSTPFNIRLAWVAAQTLSAHTNIRIYLHGWWFRQVG